MMAWIRVRSSGRLMTESTYRTENKKMRPVPPTPLDEAWLNTNGMDPVFEGPQPSLTPPYEFSFQDGVEQKDGKWYIKYSIGPVFKEYTDEDGKVQTVDAQTTEYRARVDLETAASQRTNRTSLLAKSDWTQLSDSPLTTEKKAEWVTYRQALRDLPKASGWPHTHTMPKEPS